MEAFQNDDVKSVNYFRFHQRDGSFAVDDLRKRIKRYALSNENALVWTGENDTKMLVWINIICFIFLETKTDTFEKALV